MPKITQAGAEHHYLNPELLIKFGTFCCPTEKTRLLFLGNCYDRKEISFLVINQRAELGIMSKSGRNEDLAKGKMS